MVMKSGSGGCSEKDGGDDGAVGVSGLGWRRREGTSEELEVGESMEEEVEFT